MVTNQIDMHLHVNVQNGGERLVKKASEWRQTASEPRLTGRKINNSDRTRAAVRVHLDDLQLHSLVRLRALEAVADGFHQAVDEPLAGGPAVGGVSCDVAVGDEFLPGGKKRKTKQNRVRVR